MKKTKAQKALGFVISAALTIGVFWGLGSLFEWMRGPPTARCNDGRLSFSRTHQGTCSWHGGVAEFLAPPKNEIARAPAQAGLPPAANGTQWNHSMGPTSGSDYAAQQAELKDWCTDPVIKQLAPGCKGVGQ